MVVIFKDEIATARGVYAPGERCRAYFASNGHTTGLVERRESSIPPALCGSAADLERILPIPLPDSVRSHAGKWGLKIKQFGPC